MGQESWTKHGARIGQVGVRKGRKWDSDYTLAASPSPSSHTLSRFTHTPLLAFTPPSVTASIVTNFISSSDSSCAPLDDARMRTREQELSAPEVVSYVMGWGDRYIYHQFQVTPASNPQEVGGGLPRVRCTHTTPGTRVEDCAAPRRIARRGSGGGWQAKKSGRRRTQGWKDRRRGVSSTRAL